MDDFQSVRTRILYTQPSGITGKYTVLIPLLYTSVNAVLVDLFLNELHIKNIAT